MDGSATIHIDPQRSVEFGQLAIGQLTREAIIANHLPNNLAVFLLDLALIVALARASSGTGDVLLFTK
jgi:hypothetical protein